MGTIRSAAAIHITGDFVNAVNSSLNNDAVDKTYDRYSATNHPGLKPKESSANTGAEQCRKGLLGDEDVAAILIIVLKRISY